MVTGAAGIVDLVANRRRWRPLLRFVVDFVGFAGDGITFAADP